MRLPRMVLPFVLLLAALTGCDDKPRAPALTTEAVYSNSDIGLTFLVPEGWVLYAKVNLPTDRKLDYPQRLVAYQAGGGDRKGSFDLYAIDLPEGQKLLDYLAEPKKAIGAERWTTAKGQPTEETINGATAARYIQTAVGKADRRRELVEFRRPDRTYVFTMTYKASDTQTREQAQQAVKSATWK
jgi:hypothetical protein